MKGVMYRTGQPLPVNAVVRPQSCAWGVTRGRGAMKVAGERYLQKRAQKAVRLWAEQYFSKNSVVKCAEVCGKIMAGSCAKDAKER